MPDATPPDLAAQTASPSRTGTSIAAKAMLFMAVITTVVAVAMAAIQQPAVITPASAAKSAADDAPKPTTTAGSVRHGLKDPKARTPGTVRLATYNLENMFDDKDDPALSGEYDDKDMTKPLAHRQALGKAIKAIDADVIALEEIESLEALTWFRDNHLRGLGYEFMASLDSGDHRGIECSVLSRFPLKDVKVFPDMSLGGIHPDKWGEEVNREAGKPITFRRSPLQVTVVVPAEKVAALGKLKDPNAQVSEAKPYELTLFVVHFKSGRPGAYWREAEATKTAELAAVVLTDNPEANIAILGDCNAVQTDEALQILYRQHWIDLFADRAAKDAATFSHSSERTIDHIMFHKNLSGELAFDSRFVLGTPVRDKGVDWRTTAPPDGYASDHYPVVVDLYPVNLPPTEKVPQFRSPIRPARDVQYETPPTSAPSKSNKPVKGTQ